MIPADRDDATGFWREEIMPTVFLVRDNGIERTSMTMQQKITLLNAKVIVGRPPQMYHQLMDIVAVRARSSTLDGGHV